jgi:hypothetical protein
MVTKIEVGQWYVSNNGAVAHVTNLNRLNVVSNYYYRSKIIKGNILSKGSFKRFYHPASYDKYSVIKTII